MWAADFSRWGAPRTLLSARQVVVLPATATSHPAAPLFVLDGVGAQAVGDGAGLILLDWAAQAFLQLNQARDLVFVEQRGTPSPAP